MSTWVYIAVNYSIVVVLSCFLVHSRGLSDGFGENGCHNAIAIVFFLWGQWFLHSCFKVPIAAELLRGLSHDRLNSQFKEEVQLLDLFFSFDDFMYVAFDDAPSYLAMLFSALSKLLTPRWVICRSDVRSRFLSEHILDWQYFVEKLKLLFGCPTVMICDPLSVKLNSYT